MQKPGCITTANGIMIPENGRYVTPGPIGLAGGINPYLYTGADPVNNVDPWGLAKKGLNYDPNWHGRPKGWKPTGNKPLNILPKNYKPNGINNLPGQKIPMSSNAGKGARGASCAMRALSLLEKLLEIVGSGMGTTLLKKAEQGIQLN